jgi:phospholipid/cholesterol/gamma-HCH transport system permease protein
MSNESAQPPPANDRSSVLGQALRMALIPFRFLRRQVAYVGGLSLLVLRTMSWLMRSCFDPSVRFGRFALYAQIVRVGINSMFVTTLVSGCIGLILALQMAPPLEEFGAVDQVPRIIGIAVVRELGPLITAIVLTGFAGAAITAELGTMVVGEEIEALEAHALNPVRFLVMPRLLATTLSTLVLASYAILVSLFSGGITGVWVLGLTSAVYYDSTLDALKLSDYLTGMAKAGVFGLLIGAIACYNGLSVTGGAAGVGRATTSTVVNSIVLIIIADLLFTMSFYILGWT